ncbi:MAG TPA: hypothetical protein IGR64_01010 [Leptolyngbyaceae cyanobacterium M65_K2018_010]|nr:hypothetical protein [Leptolyngbyaceae cyanobacterium M65_K2018_010]
MPHNSHPELDGERPQALYTIQLRRPGQRLKERLTWVLMGLSLGLGAMAGFLMLADMPLFKLWDTAPSPPPADDPFRLGANQAMTAAELTQTAQFKEEWVEVVLLWQQAISQMKAVPKTSAHFPLAQQKVEEYSRNLQYAQSNVNTRAPRTPNQQNYWTVGSDRDWVVAIQGTPPRVLRYSSSCNEVLRYGNSLIELTNGYVKQYSNLDGNLRVLADVPVATSTRSNPKTWTLGSSREEVLQLQGVPSRTDQYASDRRVTLYYGNSSVLLENGHVISYLNTDKNLKVSTTLANGLQSRVSQDYWSIGSSRAEVLNVQKSTPEAVSRNDSSCEETLHFGSSEVKLSQGIVIAYRNEGKNLRVR